MADIFISYSSRDRDKAEQLTELLASAGLSVWIDQQGIGAATSWSGEISKAIEECKALVLLLSPTSIESDNVRKEVSLAAERQKKILPLDLEPVTLPHDLAYHLAGIQRTSMTNIDSIIRALGRLGLEATQVPQPPRITHSETDQRKSLIIMPFDDLSPTQDNQWFADGLVGELIDILGKIKSLRILDRKTSLGLRTVTHSTIQIGKEFNTRYFIEGSVRKFGEQIKISVSLLDIETGDHLWQESYKGVMADIFELQESVATQVVEGLKLHLTNEEKSLLAERGTDNSEAYELWMKAKEYSDLNTKAGLALAAELFGEAILLDPDYVKAYSGKANALTEMYRVYDPDPSLLDEAQCLCNEARKRKPDYFMIYSALVDILMHRGQMDEAEQMAKDWVEKEPDNFGSHFELGFFYQNTDQMSKAVEPYETSLRLKEDSLAALSNITTACDATGEFERCSRWSAAALPHIERHLRLHPDDEHFRVTHALMLNWIGQKDDALRAARKLVDESSVNHIRDGRSLYNTACLFRRLDQVEDTLYVFRKAIMAGFRNLFLLKNFLDEDISSLAGTPEYEEVKRMVEEIEREAEAKKNG